MRRLVLAADASPRAASSRVRYHFVCGSARLKRWSVGQTNMRAIKYAGLTFGFFTLALLCAASVPEHLFFEGLRNEYRQDEILTFAVRSSAAQPILFSCSVEWLDKGQWREVVTSIHKPLGKEALLYPLSPSARIPLRFKPPYIKSERAWLLSPGSYRFRLDVFETNTQKQLGSVASSPFKILARS